MTIISSQRNYRSHFEPFFRINRSLEEPFLCLKSKDIMPINMINGGSFMKQSSFEMKNLMKIGMCLLSSLFLMLFYNNCAGNTAVQDEIKNTISKVSAYQITLDFIRLNSGGLSPFRVRATLTEDGQPTAGKTLQLNIPQGTVGVITDNHNGTYDFIVTPSAIGVYPVEVSYGGTTIRRDAVVTSQVASGVGQPLAVPGTYVNTSGYEDGITITPDGNYLFIQYGPLYFAGIAGVLSICSNPAFSMVDILGCSGKTNSNWVFDTIGPYSGPLRPNFPVGAISGGHLTHTPIVIPGVANGIPIFPTVFYGFKKQSDGTFAQPFKLAFDDVKGTNGPFGLSFQMTSATTAKFAVAWNNYFDDLGGDQYPNIYTGNVTMGQNNSLGTVSYAGDGFASITPNITPVSFSSHAGVQGNPHLYYDSGGVVKSIWTDDEQVTHDLAVYSIVSGTYPSGTWNLVTLPSKINTAASESQPFFTGTRLYLNRDTKIVYHDYVGSGGNDYHLNSSWGNEVVVLAAPASTAIGAIIGFGEPTIATVGGKKYLYFVYVKIRAYGASAGSMDYDLDAGFVEVP